MQEPHQGDSESSALRVLLAEPAADDARRAEEQLRKTWPQVELLRVDTKQALLDATDPEDQARTP